MRIAVLITCHNRRDQALVCLEALFQNKLPDGYSLDVFLVDDGSQDGTGGAVRRQFPEVHVVDADGSLFWNGGMRLAFVTAMKQDFDYYLWLNDDTILKPTALAEMLSTAQTHFGIIVGSCCDPNTGVWTYGGRSTPFGKKSLKGTPVQPSGQVQCCQLINGNVVLVPKLVVARIGTLSDSFTHGIGDFDYGFRALNAGISIIVPPNYQATCSTNPLPAWCSPDTPLWKRLALFNTPKGIHFHEFMVFCSRHFGIKSIFIGLKVILRVLYPQLWVRR